MDHNATTATSLGIDQGNKHGVAAGTLPAAGAYLKRKPAATQSSASHARRRLVTRISHERGCSWAVFVAQYEQFTDMICAAAQYGLSEAREQEYQALRHWFTEHYYEHAHRVRPLLDAADVCAEPTGLAGAASSRNVDCFEALFLPRSLHELLAHDDGSLIGLISHVSHAIFAVKS